MGVLRGVLCFSLMVIHVNCGILKVEKCKLEDSACVKTQYQAAVPVFMSGLPDIGVEVLDVMNMDDVKFDLAGLQFTLSDGKLKGLKNSVVDDVKWNVKNKHIFTEFHTDATVRGHYTAAGRVLILPIAGDGSITLKLKKVHIKLNIDYDMVKGADGEDHVKLSKLKFDFDVKENAHFHLTNLFNGNQELSDAMLKFLNENWKQITVEFGKPIIESAAKTLYKNIKTYFEKEAIGDIALV